MDEKVKLFGCSDEELQDLKDASDGVAKKYKRLRELRKVEGDEEWSEERSMLELSDIDKNFDSLTTIFLDSSLKTLTYELGKTKFWSKTPKTPAYSTVGEFDQLEDMIGVEWDEERSMRELAKVDTGRETPASSTHLDFENFHNAINKLYTSVTRDLFTQVVVHPETFDGLNKLLEDDDE